MFDSFTDLPDDCIEGLTKVKPSFINRGRLLLSSFSDAVVVFRNIRPTIKLMGQVGMRTIETAENNPHRYLI